MELVKGKPLLQGRKLKEVRFKDQIIELINQKFSGYVCLTIEGFEGVEEGTLIFRVGNIIASAYEYLKYGIIVNGDAAIQQVFNASAADYGVVDIIELGATEAELIIAVHPKTRTKLDIKTNDVKKLVPNSFNPNFAKKTLQVVMKQYSSSSELFKKFGFSEIKVEG